MRQNTQRPLTELAEVRLVDPWICLRLDADRRQVVDDDRHHRLVSGIGVELDRDHLGLVAGGQPLVVGRLGRRVVGAVLAHVLGKAGDPGGVMPVDTVLMPL